MAKPKLSMTGSSRGLEDFFTGGLGSLQDAAEPTGLVDRDGNPVPTAVSEVSREEAREYTKKAGWYIDWADQPDNVTIYKVTANGSSEAEGLMGIQNDPNAQAARLTWIVSAPQNQGKNTHGNGKKFGNVPGVLLSRAVDESIDMGYNGFIVSKAANSTVLKVWEGYGAERIGSTYEIYFDESAAADIRRRYSWR